MTSKSKLGAIALMAAIGLASPAFAQYSPSATGGGSAGYNAHNNPNYKLKKHHAKPHGKLHASAKMKEKKASK